MTGLLLVLGVGLVLLTPAFAVFAARRAGKAPAWLQVLGRLARATNAALYVASFTFLLVMVIWLLARSK